MSIFPVFCHYLSPLFGSPSARAMALFLSLFPPSSFAAVATASSSSFSSDIYSHSFFSIFQKNGSQPLCMGRGNGWKVKGIDWHTQQWAESKFDTRYQLCVFACMCVLWLAGSLDCGLRRRKSGSNRYVNGFGAMFLFVSFTQQNQLPELLLLRLLLLPLLLFAVCFESIFLTWGVSFCWTFKATVRLHNNKFLWTIAQYKSLCIFHFLLTFRSFESFILWFAISSFSVRWNFDENYGRNRRSNLDLFAGVVWNLFAMEFCALYFKSTKTKRQRAKWKLRFVCWYSALERYIINRKKYSTSERVDFHFFQSIFGALCSFAAHNTELNVSIAWNAYTTWATFGFWYGSSKPFAFFDEFSRTFLLII